MNFAQHRLRPWFMWASILSVIVTSVIIVGMPERGRSQSTGSSNPSTCTSTSSAFSLGITPVATTSGSSNSTIPITVSGPVNVIVGIPTGTTIAKVLIRSNEQTIGQARPSGSSSWSMPWPTSLHANGTAKIDALVYGSTTSTAVTTCSVMTNVNNATRSSLIVNVQPSSWEGPMSYSFPIHINVTAGQPASNVNQYGLYQWGATIGSINPSLSQAQYSSGGTVGTGSVNAIVRYGGTSSTINIPITINDPNTPLPDSQNETSTSSTTDTTTRTVTSTETIKRQTAVQNNPAAQDCIINTLGADRFEAINSGISRPNVDEIKKVNVCFSSSNYILPSNFAPVAPTTIKELTKTDRLFVKTPENVTKTHDESTTEVLKLSGTATPNSLVLIYIFSDPLVLTTTADANGDWTYTLEDPIEAGQHEVYTVVDRGDGVYERSDPLSFFIDTAEAAEANPAGLSLRLAASATPAQSNRSLYLYIAALMAILVVVFGFFTLFLKRQRLKAETTSETPQVLADETSLPEAEPNTPSEQPSQNDSSLIDSKKIE